MFDYKSLQASPGMARILKDYHEFKALDISQEILDLSELDLFEPDTPMTTGQRSAIQFMLDWKGRGILTGSDKLLLWDTALTVMSYLPSQPTLVCCDPGEYTSWRLAILNKFPDAVISVFGPSHVQDAVVTTGPDVSASWFITSFSYVFTERLLSRVKVGRMVMTEINQKPMNMKWFESLASLFQEIPASMILYPIKSTDNIQSPALYSLISDLVIRYIWAGHESPQMLSAMSYGSSSYLRARGYQTSEPEAMLRTFGVTMDLSRLP
jgi:hypothetical protein